MLLLTSTYWLLYIVSLLQAITLCLFLPGMASSILFFWLQYQFILIEVVLFRSCGVSFLDSSTRGFIVACGFVIFLCVNMHCILSILEGNSLEESVKNVISSYSFCSTTYCAGSDSDSTSDFQKLAEKGKVYLETVGNATAASAVIGTGLAIGRSPEAAMVAIYSFTFTGDYPVFFLPGMASSVLFFWLQYPFILIGVVLFRSCGVSFLDCSIRGVIMACGFIIFLCINMHCILGILEGHGLEESVKNVISSYSFCLTTFCAGSDSTSDFQKLAEKGKICLETVGNATAASAVIGTNLAIGRSPEAAMVAIVRASPHTKIVIGTGMIGVVLFRSCGVSFLDCSTRGFIMACGFIIFLCINIK